MNDNTPEKTYTPLQQRVFDSLRRRRHKEMGFRLLGMSAVTISLALVVVLFASIFSKGLPAFWQATFVMNVHFDPAVITFGPKPVQQSGETDAQFSERQMAWDMEVGFVDFNQLILNALAKVEPETLEHPRDAMRLVTSGERFALRDMVVENPALIGQTVQLSLLADANVDVWIKGNIDRSLPDDRQQLSARVRAWSDELYAAGVIQNKFSTAACPMTANNSARACASGRTNSTLPV